jgi:hypothetical protein
MAFQSTTKFLPGSRWFVGSHKFIIDKFGDLSLLEPKSSEVIGSSTGRLPPAPVRVDLINEAQLEHGFNALGKVDLDPARDKVDHTLAVPAAIANPIYMSPSESDSEDGRGVYMVRQQDQLPEKTTEEIQRDALEEIARAERLAREADKGKRHNRLQDDSGASEDEPSDGAPSRRHHPKFNSRRTANRDRL